MSLRQTVLVAALALHTLVVVLVAAAILASSSAEAVMLFWPLFWMDFPASLGVCLFDRGEYAARDIIVRSVYHLVVGGAQYYVVARVVLYLVTKGTRTGLRDKDDVSG